MCKKNAVFVKYVDVPTDCVGSRNTSCRGTGLKVTMNRKKWRNITGRQSKITKLMKKNVMGNGVKSTT
jgi:hydroxyethylthiazole kinase-like sugar kinase family protein